MPAQIGYGDLVQRLLGQSLHKAETRTDWSRRPLSAAQMAYALDDVRYLLPLRDRLRERLRATGALAVVRPRKWRSSMQSAPFRSIPQQAWRRIKGFCELDAARQRLARALAAWREQRAISADRPRNWILPDAALRDIVLRVPRTLAELGGIAELPEGILNHSGAQILAVIEARAAARRAAAIAAAAPTRSGR